MLWWKVVSGDGDNWSALPMGAAVIETGVTVQPVCKLKCFGCMPAAKKKNIKNRANGCIVWRENSFLIIQFLKIKEKIQKSEKRWEECQATVPATHPPLFLKWGEEHFENWPKDNSILCQSQGIQIYFSLH